MQTFVPNYYSQFHCIANRCRHSCCIGWEIDIDSASLERYQKEPGELGEQLRQNIILDECPHFKLGKDERCPFLNEDNLCRLILADGERTLCQICTDHPRFRNFFPERTELGLGLCCEAAAALILSFPLPFSLVRQGEGSVVQPAGTWKVFLLKQRKQALLLLQNRNLPFWERVRQLLREFDTAFPSLENAQWADFLLSLERMDREWDAELSLLRSADAQACTPLSAEFELCFEQLSCYFIFRHVSPAEDEADLKARIAFSVFGCHILHQLYCLHRENGGCSFDDFVNLARLYSCEIEYSEENTQAILDLLWNVNNSEAIL